MSEIIKAYVVANVKRGAEHKIVQQIQTMKAVTEVLITYGLWDIIVRIEAKSLGQLDEIITEIRQIEEVEQTSTLIGS